MIETWPPSSPGAPGRALGVRGGCDTVVAIFSFCRDLRRGLAAAAALVVVACGYSEDEWQAQLAKYNQLNNQYTEEQRELEATRAELETSKKQVASLSSELEKQGVDVENLNR